MQVSTGGKDAIAAVCRNGSLWSYNAKVKNWDNLNLPAPSKAKLVSIGQDGEMFALNVGGEVFRRSLNAWKKISGKCVQLDVADKDNVMCVNAAG